MIYLCPKCDKGISKSELNAGQCDHCMVKFNVKGLDKALDEDLFIKKFAADIQNDIRHELTNKKRIKYHDSMINMIKAVLHNVVLIKRSRKTSIFFIQDAEVKCYLFDILNKNAHIIIETDVVVYGKDIQDLRGQSCNTKFLKSRLTTREFDYALDICCRIYNQKVKNIGHHTKRLHQHQFGFFIDMDK